MESLIKGFAVAAMVIFLLLASQFRSYIQPVIIMCAIPFGLVGAVAGHFIMGLDITMISIFGIVALSGIVVNDSLILIDFINTRVRSGKAVFDAVIEADSTGILPSIDADDLCDAWDAARVQLTEWLDFDVDWLSKCVEKECEQAWQGRTEQVAPRNMP